MKAMIQRKSLVPADDPADQSDLWPGVPPLLRREDHGAPSVFRPENMLREARRQKGIAAGPVPRVCILDPDGDLVDFVKSEHRATKSRSWACYHTSMWEWEQGGIGYGIVGYAVGGPFSVLVAEQLFVSGCSLLISIASAGQIADRAERAYHVLIERALRDEGTSHHYLPASIYAEAEPRLLRLAREAVLRVGVPVLSGATWTTDAPFRETEGTIARRKAEGLLAVEMEAAALYAFAAARKCAVLCLAHVTNQFGRSEGDFEKGPRNGAEASLQVVASIAGTWAKERGFGR
jgi:uridine phosphorylase